MRRVPLWRPRRHAIAWMWSHWSLKCDAIGGRLKAASSSQLKTQNTDAQKCQKMQKEDEAVAGPKLCASVQDLQMNSILDQEPYVSDVSRCPEFLHVRSPKAMFDNKSQRRQTMPLSGCKRSPSICFCRLSTVGSGISSLKRLHHFV